MITQTFLRGEVGGDIVLPATVLLGEQNTGLQVAWRYLTLGVEHILFGWDHIALVLGLCLLASGWSLFRLVTAFTIGHSITLSLASIGWVNLPLPPVEACIALSVALIARLALVKPTGSNSGVPMGFAIGLLHGLGFASALSAAGLGRYDLLIGLVSFNLGVEIGQLLFIGAVLLACRIVAESWLWGGRVRAATAFGVGTLGMYWTLERTLLLGG